jgi:4-hydroxy-3-methylbut-2-enyl diphosphate reductase
LAEKHGTPAYLIDTAENIQQAWITEDVACVGVTAGASAPEVLVKQVIEKLQSWGGQQVEENPGREENITFSVPPELRIDVGVAE